MHFHFDFSAVQVIWTLTFAALLVLLVVLIGRDRARRFPLFTTAIVLMALRMLMSRMLYGRLAPLLSSEIFLAMADLAAIVSVLVLVEMARRAFMGAKRVAWLVGTLILLAVAGVVVWKWGQWPAAQTVFARSTLAVLMLMQLAAQKIDLAADLLTIELGLLVVLLGRRFHAGWSSHTQKIVIGLSTTSIAQTAMRVILQQIAQHTTVRSQADYERAMGLQEKLLNANNAIYLAAIVWWIVWLWFDEKGASPIPAEVSAEPLPEIAPESEAPKADN